MASEIISVVTFVGNFTVAPIVKQVKYVFNYKENMTKLPTEVQKLMDLKQDIEGLVSSARGNAEDIKPSVEAWMKEADRAAESALQIVQEEEEQSKKRCFIGRHRSSRRAFKEREQILQVLTSGREFRESSASFPVEAAPSFATLGRGFLDFDSRSGTWEDILMALKDPDANVIGVYGMGGVGKTTLVRQVAARAAEEKLFDEVVMPVVTPKNVLDVKELQNEMAKVLGMKLDDQWNVSQRAARVFKRLTQKTNEKAEKKTLVILDDLRGVLDLERVGIPFGADVKGCKILFTSRFRYVSYAAQRVFTIGVLEEEEAWRLFQKTAGDVLEDPSFFNVGKEVTLNCKGLPILIVTVVGSLLRRRSLGAWKDALVNLQRNENKEMQEFVDSALEFISFNHLPDANKSLFLLCGLIGGNTEISTYDLLRYGIGWGLFKHTKTVEEARNNLETLILDLKASFLLLDGQSVEFVKMHDVVRDVAVKIASNDDHNMLVGSSEEWPEDDMLRRCTALAFPYGIVPQLPECLESPSLEFLMLYQNNSLLKIVDNSFEKMLKLTVLDITAVDLFPTLPSSLALLHNLQTLCLDGCKLGDISIVGALKKLKILSLMYSSIEKLPMEIGDLSELRVLNLEGCSDLKIIPHGVLQRLSQLEELNMSSSFVEWEAEGHSQRSNASLDELICLPDLTTLRIHIPDAKLLPKDFYFKKLERFTILIGDEEWDWTCHNDLSLYRFRGMKIKINSSINTHLEVGVKEMLKKTEILYLDGMKNIHELEWKSFQELKFVHIQHSAETRYIVNATEHRTQDKAFPAVLESLFLSHLFQLQYICMGQFMAEASFNKLKLLNVNNCNSLRSLFSFSIARGLVHLEKIKLTECEALEVILEDTREDGKNGDTAIDKLEFPQLRSLILRCLPKLASFCNNVKSSPSFPNRQKLVMIGSEDSCTTIVPFFSEKVLFPRLEELTLSEIPYLTEIWPQPGIMSFKNLTELTVENCGSIKYLFTHSVAICLEQLTSIRIQSCRLLKEIVTQVEGEETNEILKFSQLISLELEDLPCLTRFCSGSSIVFPSLECLSIDGCRQLETFLCQNTIKEDKTVSSKNEKLCPAMLPLFSEMVELPNLNSLFIFDLHSVKTIWHDRLHEHSFFKLERVYIIDCPNLLKVFPSTMLRRIQGLEKLQLSNNCFVEQVFENYEMVKPNTSGGEAREDVIKFSQLNFLRLDDLSNLKRFCLGSSVLFPALTELRILRCKQLETFLNPFAVTDRKGVEEMESNDNRSPIMQPLFNEKVEFPSLKELELQSLDSIKTIWHCQIHEDSFCTLEQLTIWKCANLLRIFPLTMLRRIQNLKKLQMADIPLVEEIIEAPRLHMNDFFDVTTTNQLSELTLANLPKLKCVWGEDLGQILSFHNLHEVAVHYCQSLKYLFPASMAQQLHHLEVLYITNCAVETIICHKEEEEVKEEDAAFVFPKLIKLWLQDLPKLDSICSRSCTIQWPSLNNLSVVGMFPSDIVKFTEYGGEGQFKKLVSNLAHLTTNRKDATMVTRHCNLFPELFHNLKSLSLDKFNDESADFPLPFLQRFHNLEALYIRSCSFQDIFLHEGSVDGEEVKYLDRLKHLELYQLDKLKCIWKEGSLLIPILEKLESLTVLTCPDLTNIVPGLVSFKFLAVLEVQNCDGLVNLVQMSTAKSLVQITTLKVTECERVKEIVACESTDMAEDKVVFSKLKTLELRRLPSLVNFCPGNYDFKFPLLEEVIVIECLNMKTFCGGITSSPKLQKVSLTLEVLLGILDIEEVEWQEDKDLNTIIQKEAQRLIAANATSSLKNHPEPEAQICENSTNPSKEDEVCENGNVPGTKTEMCENGKMAEICEDAVKYSKEIAEMNDEATMPEEEAATCKVVEKFIKEVAEMNDEATQPQEEAGTCEDVEKFIEEVAEMNDEATMPEEEAETCEKAIQSKKNDRFCEKIVKPTEEVHTYDKAMESNDCEIINSRKDHLEDIQGSLTPTPDIVDVTCTTSQSHTALGNAIGAATCQQNDDFQGLQVAQLLVPLLEKARHKHGDFHISPLIKLKTVRVTAMESVGQVLHILQTQPPRTIDAEKIQFMEDAFHDLSNMSFPIEWLRPLIEKPRKCLLSVQRRTIVYELNAKIVEMEAQLEILKREMEVETASVEEFDKEMGCTTDLDRPLLDI